MHPIHCILTGGTVAERYDPHATDRRLRVDTYSVSDRLMKLAPDMCQYTHLMSKDSLEMNDDDRAQLAKAVVESPSWRVLVIHGTGTMVKSAGVIAQALKAARRDKLVVLTGSMIPIREVESDADFHLGGALLALQTAMTLGVYIAMSGHFFPWDQCYKNERKQRFYRKVD